MIKWLVSQLIGTAKYMHAEVTVKQSIELVE